MDPAPSVLDWTLSSMRNALVNFLLVGAVLAQPQGFPAETRTPEGVRVWDFGDPTGDKILFTVFVAVGSRLEDSDQHGMAHLVEHCLFRSTRKRSGADVAALLEGVASNGHTSYDYTAYHFEAAPSQALPLIELFGEMITQPAFKRHEVTLEQSIVCHEITERDLHLNERVAQDLIFPGDALGRSCGGTCDGVRGFSLDAIRGFYDEHYRARNIIVAFSGPGDRTTLGRIIARAFREVAPGGAMRPDIETPRKQVGTHMFGPMDQTGISITGFHLVDLTPKTLAAAWVASQIVRREGLQRIRVDRGLVYSLGVAVDAYLDAWVLKVSAKSSTREEMRAADGILTEIIDGLRDIDDETFNEARDRTAAALLPRNHGELATLVHKTWLLMQHGSSPPDALRELRALTRDEFADMARNLNGSHRFWMTNDPTLGDRKGPPWLAILGVLIGGLLILDAFFGFRGVRGVGGRPVIWFRKAKGAVRSVWERRLRGKERRVAVNNLEEEIQAWFGEEEREGRTPSGD